MRRRTILRGAAAGVAAAFSGCNDRVFDGGGDDDVGTPTRTPRAPEADDGRPVLDDYGTVVDLVEEGADPTGEESIRPLLEEHAGDDTLIYLDDGTFLVNDTVEIRDVSKFALFGPGATLVPAEGWTSVAVFVEAVEGLRVEGLEFDYTDAAGGRALLLRAGDGLFVRDVTVNGRFDAGSPVRLDVTDSGGSGLVENLRLPDGAAPDTQATGVYVGNLNAGDLTFRNCHVEGFPDNGLYADPPDGDMHVEGGYYANNGIANVRVNSGSTVRNVHVRCDDDHPGFRNMRGIRANDYAPRPGGDPVLVEGCRIELIEVSYSDGAIVQTSNLAELEIRDTYIRVDATDVNAIRAKPPDPALEVGDRTTAVRCDDVTVSGVATGGAAISIVERDGCRFDGLFVHQTGQDRDGIEFRRSRNNVVDNSVLDVRGDPIRLVDATAEVTRTMKNPTNPPITGIDRP